jgi:hypothetical protein
VRKTLSTSTYLPVWRSSTPEPSRGDGIIWTYIKVPFCIFCRPLYLTYFKDVTRYIPLLSQPGILQLELDNLLSDSLGLDGQYDGIWAFLCTTSVQVVISKVVTFSITYFSSSPKSQAAPKSDLIVGITNFTSVPGQFTVSYPFAYRGRPRTH